MSAGKASQSTSHRFPPQLPVQAYAKLLENNPFLRFLLAAFRFVVCVCDPDPTSLPTTRGDAFLKAEKDGIFVCPDAALDLVCDFVYEHGTDGHNKMVARVNEKPWSED